MKKIIHYILIAIMFNWNVAVFAEGDQGCEWKTFEETDSYVMENCVKEDGSYSARVRQKPEERESHKEIQGQGRRGSQGHCKS